MSARRILATSLLISLLGHLVIFTTFSVATFKGEERPPELTRVSFLGEFVEEKPSLRVEAVVREGKRPQLQPMVRELEVGPGPDMSKPRPTVPAPQISLEGIISLLAREETSLLQAEITGEGKANPPKRSHLRKKEQDE